MSLRRRLEAVEDRLGLTPDGRRVLTVEDWKAVRREVVERGLRGQAALNYEARRYIELGLPQDEVDTLMQRVAARRAEAAATLALYVTADNGSNDQDSSQ